MRRSYTLSATNPSAVAELPFTPSSVLILNNTDKSVYMNIGRAVVPSATFFDMETLPAASGIPSNVALPNNSNLFAMYLPTPTNTTKTVTVIFQGTADPFSNRVAFPTRGVSPLPGGSGGLGALSQLDVGSQMFGGGRMQNYQMFRLNASNVRQVMELSWLADMMFVLNNSDAWVYIREGGVSPPSNTYYDVPLPPQSYTILNPHGGFQFSALLDSPSQKDCFIIFAYGYADEYMAYKQLFGEWDWYLPPLTIPAFIWNFDLPVFPPIPPISTIWNNTNTNLPALDGWTPYNAGAGNLAQRNGGNTLWQRNTSVSTTRVSVYNNFTPGTYTWVDKIQVRFSQPTFGSWTITARLYDVGGMPGVGGIGSNVLETRQVSGSGSGSPYHWCTFSPSSYCAGISLDMIITSPENVSLLEGVFCFRGDVIMTGTVSGACGATLSPTFPFSGC
jgi:hypothetical protein